MCETYTMADSFLEFTLDSWDASKGVRLQRALPKADRRPAVLSKKISPPETNSSPMKIDVWKTSLSLREGLLSGAMVVLGSV